MKTKTVLVATRPELLAAAHQIYLKPEFNLVFCTTLNEAVESMDQEIDLIACGVHFGDGEVYDLLRRAKAHPKTRNVPFLVIDSGEVELFSYVEQSVEIASRALGATAVIPITRWRRELGDEGAFENYRQAMRRILQPSPVGRR
jgi:CheY-like chemotaxis protein